jgi:hypothetical protein
MKKSAVGVLGASGNTVPALTTRTLPPAARFTGALLRIVSAMSLGSPVVPGLVLRAKTTRFGLPVPSTMIEYS